MSTEARTSDDEDTRLVGLSVMLLIPAPTYSLAQAAWIPRLAIWQDDDTTERREDI